MGNFPPKMHSDRTHRVKRFSYSAGFICSPGPDTDPLLHTDCLGAFSTVFQRLFCSLRFSSRKTGSYSDTSSLTGLIRLQLSRSHAEDVWRSRSCVPVQIQPPGWRPQRGIARHWSDARMHVAAHRAVPLRFRVQREVPHHHSQPRLLLPVRQLHRQQPAGEEKAGVRFTSAITIILSGPIYRKQQSLFSVSWDPTMLTSIRSHIFFSEGTSAVLTTTIIFQSVWEDSLSMESSLCKPDRLLKPSVPAWTQPGTGTAPAIYRPPLFQVGYHNQFWKCHVCFFPL